MRFAKRGDALVTSPGELQNGMKPEMKRWVMAGLCAIALAPGALGGQATPPAARGQQVPQMRRAGTSSVSVDGSEAMFTTMCALLAAGFEAEISAGNWSAFRSQMRDRLQHQEGPAVEALREFYRAHRVRDEGLMLSRYLWFGLVSGAAPDFPLTLRRDELPPEVLTLEGFSEILSAYYKEQQIGVLWRQAQPIYGREISRLHDTIAQLIFVTSGYLREVDDSSRGRRFTIVIEPLVGRITNVRNFGDHYAIVLSGAEEIPVDVVRHAYLHYLMDPLPLQYSHVVAVKKAIFERAATAPRLQAALKDDFPSYFAECAVRAVELKLKRMSPGERDAALERAEEDGYVLERPLFAGLTKFEQSEPSMKLYFPDWVRGVDAAAEVKRASAIHFAAAVPAQEADPSEEAVARRPTPVTVPNDQEAIALLTEGERRVAERNPRAAEAAFRRVLAKYPDQVRAWYGLGLVALMDHDGPRAKEVFGRLTTGEHAATQDPLVLTWSHVYLARIYFGDGDHELAKTEFQAALDVQGGPDQARQAAQRGLADVASEKGVARP
jgi:tetratricopeptide (TPR) repeat protein